jgi:hypothetical protein
MKGVCVFVGATKSTVMWPPVDANPLSPCQGVSLQAIFRAGDVPKGTKNVPDPCLLNAPFAQLPDYIVCAYPFLRELLFRLFGFGLVECPPDDTAECRGRGGSHWWMVVKSE